MAVEIDLPCDVNVPTVDYSVPAPGDLKAGMLMALRLLRTHGAIYAGCMGGIGRTGLFMVAMKKLEARMQGRANDTKIMALVNDVRANYHPHAVETLDQSIYLLDLDIEAVALFAKYV